MFACACAWASSSLHCAPRTVTTTILAGMSFHLRPRMRNGNDDLSNKLIYCLSPLKHSPWLVGRQWLPFHSVRTVHPKLGLFMLDFLLLFFSFVLSLEARKRPFEREKKGPTHTDRQTHTHAKGRKGMCRTWSCVLVIAHQESRSSAQQMLGFCFPRGSYPGGELIKAKSRTLGSRFVMATLAS